MFKGRFFLLYGILISFIGLAMLYSALHYKQTVVFPHLFIKQVIFLALSLFVYWAFSSLDYHRLKGVAFVFYLVSIALLILVLFAGSVRYGARRWLKIAGFVFQPAELAKISVILMLSYVMSMAEKLNVKKILLAVFIALLPFVLILKEPDLGTSLVILPITVAILYINGLSWKVLAGLFVSGAAVAPFLWHFLKDYQKRRVLVFLNPEIDPLGAGYTITQSRVAIGSGGLWGKGWLSGTQNQLNFLPERHTDFIFSIFAEEWGFIGVIVLFALFIGLLLYAIDTSRRARDRFGKSMAMGIAVYFFAHIFVNIAMTAGFLPVVGLPLPFVSYGGTSLLISFMGLGILQSIRIQANV